ncbi:MAG: vanadium-dependent haloperoxidase [Anaerolineae bacterium]|nr:vanadium-dependent haloperoxidase [Anaerolineae bacterium]
MLKSGNQFRPPAPPAYDSPQMLAELAEIKAFTRTFNSNAKAMYYQASEGSYYIWSDTASQRIFEHHLDTNPPRAARAYALMSVARMDAVIACWDAKYAYWAMRPAQIDNTITTLFPAPNHPSYPAGHGCNSGAGAHVLAYLFPDEGKFIEDKADEAGLSRIWAGIHFRSDVEVGLKLGRQVADEVIAWAKKDGA